MPQTTVQSMVRAKGRTSISKYWQLKRLASGLTSVPLLGYATVGTDCVPPEVSATARLTAESESGMTAKPPGSV